MRDAIQHALDDAAWTARRRLRAAGSALARAAVDRTCTPDVLIHTRDLARATGLDPDKVRHRLAGVEQTRLLAFMGRAA